MDALRTVEFLVISRTPLIGIKPLEDEIQAARRRPVTRAEEVEELPERALDRTVPAS